MIEFYVRRGPHVISYGTCQEETKDLVFAPDGGVVVFEPVPADAMQSPPEPGALWNLETHQWDLPEITIEQAWHIVRHRRDQLLTASDWVVLRAADRGEPVPPEWLAYRQALRDITKQPDPMNIDWPTPPQD